MSLSFIPTIGRGLANGASYLFAPRRWKATVAAITVAAILALVLWIGHIRSNAAQARLDAATAEQHSAVLEGARRADGAALGTTAAIKGTAVSQEVKNRVKTEEALAKNPGWATEPVPADVLGSLRK